MNRPRISAVIPAFNRERTIERAAESALTQSEPPEEILVVDDGSTDATADRVARLGDRVRYVFQDNAGASAARNLGVEIAAEDWIAFLDSDDFWRPEHLSRMRDAIQATRGVADLYFSDMRRAPDEGSVMLWDACHFSPRSPWQLAQDGKAWALMRRQPMMLQSSVVRRSRYLEIGGLRDDLRSRHDTHLFLLLGIGSPVCAVAGCGTEMTCDDASGNRVTTAFGARTPAYWHETVRLYDDVVARFCDSLTPDDLSELRERQAGGELRLAGLDWAKGRRLSAVRSVVRAWRAHPRRVLEGASRVLGRLRLRPAPAE